MIRIRAEINEIEKQPIDKIKKKKKQKLISLKK